MSVTIAFQTIREEICQFLRNQNIFTTTIRGVTTTTDNYVATAGQTNFTLTHTNVKNIRSVTVASVSMAYLTDYTINWATGVVTLLVGATLSDAVAINYDYGTGDKIYPDYPRDDLTLESYPRIGIELISTTTEPFGLGGLSHISDILLTVFLWIPINKATSVAGGIGGNKDAMDYISTIRSSITLGGKGFKSFQYITPTSSPVITKSHNNKVMQVSQDFSIKHKVENS